MRVALQADQLAFAAPGGIATYVRNLAPALARRYADVTLLHARSGAWPAEPWMAGMDVVEIDRKSTRLNSSHVSESRMPSSA